MQNKSQEEKDREELATFRLKELLNNPMQFNLTLLTKLENLEVEMEKIKKGINLVLENLENSQESNEEVVVKEIKELPKEENKEDDEDTEDEDEDDDLGYSPQIPPLKKETKRI